MFKIFFYKNILSKRFIFIVALAIVYSTVSIYAYTSYPDVVSSFFTLPIGAKVIIESEDLSFFIFIALTFLFPFICNNSIDKDKKYNLHSLYCVRSTTKSIIRSYIVSSIITSIFMVFVFYVLIFLINSTVYPAILPDGFEPMTASTWLYNLQISMPYLFMIITMIELSLFMMSLSFFSIAVKIRFNTRYIHNLIPFILNLLCVTLASFVYTLKFRMDLIGYFALNKSPISSLIHVIIYTLFGFILLWRYDYEKFTI